MKKNPAVAGSLTLQLRCGDITIVSHSLPTSAVTHSGAGEGESRTSIPISNSQLPLQRLSQLMVNNYEYG